MLNDAADDGEAFRFFEGSNAHTKKSAHPAGEGTDHAHPHNRHKNEKTRNTKHQSFVPMLLLGFSDKKNQTPTKPCVLVGWVYRYRSWRSSSLASTFNLEVLVLLVSLMNLQVGLNASTFNASTFNASRFKPCAFNRSSGSTPSTLQAFKLQGTKASSSLVGSFLLPPPPDPLLPQSAYWWVIVC